MPAGAQTSHDCAEATRAIVDQGYSLGAVANGYAQTHHLAVDGIQRRMPGAGRRIARAPLRRAAEIALADEAVVLQRLVDLDFLALDEILVLAAAHTGPRNTEMCEFANRDRCFVSKYVGDFLVGAPVGASHRVEEVHGRVVALGLRAVGQRRLHAALRRAAVAAPRRHQREDHRLLSRGSGFDGTTFTGETAADYQDIGSLEPRGHEPAPSSKNCRGGSSHPASTINVRPPRPRTTQKMICSTRYMVLRDIQRSAPHLIASRYRPMLA